MLIKHVPSSLLRRFTTLYSVHTLNFHFPVRAAEHLLSILPPHHAILLSDSTIRRRNECELWARPDSVHLLPLTPDSSSDTDDSTPITAATGAPWSRHRRTLYHKLQRLQSADCSTDCHVFSIQCMSCFGFKSVWIWQLSRGAACMPMPMPLWFEVSRSDEPRQYRYRLPNEDKSS